ncbi:MAG TPA: proline--tRNA ligase, partial [Bdellovibrionales bacterium]|nr:proline--tRNA ligase [Bdellovibrionales bacterium]
MRWSESYLFTLKDKPADAEIPSHQLMVRGGYIRKLAPGIFTYGPFFLRALKKFEHIIREELGKKGGVEILMPMVHPKEIWEETGRWKEMGAGLLKFKNRNDQEFCLGATHEEAVTDYVRGDVKSYRDLPFNLFQIQTKFRDEIRPRFGLMRGREFVMKDAYSFDVDKAGALKAYEKMYSAYEAIFQRLGVDFRIVKADSGNIGGDQSQEFHILAQSGEDELLVCENSDFAANVEVCPAVSEPVESSDSENPLEKFETPHLKTIDQLAKALKVPSQELVKTLFFNKAEPDSEVFEPVCVLTRGSDEANPIKLKNLWGLSNPPRLLSDKEVFEVSGAHPGSCGPVGLKMPVWMDHSLKGRKNMVVGANEDGYHYRNANLGRDFKVAEFADLRMAKEGDLSPDGKGT